MVILRNVVVIRYDTPSVYLLRIAAIEDTEESLKDWSIEMGFCDDEEQAEKFIEDYLLWVESYDEIPIRW